MTLLDDVLTLEEDEDATEEQEVHALQRMISAGHWSFQGHMGRAMMDAIDAGVCVLGPNPAHDYWGNRIPSRYEVQPGTKGSVGYAGTTEEAVLAIEADR